LKYAFRKESNKVCSPLNIDQNFGRTMLSCSPTQSCPHEDIRVRDGLRSCLACEETVFNQLVKKVGNFEHQPSTRYRYNYLNYGRAKEIRLLILQPGREEDELTCDIIHVNLVDKPVYEALSYTWSTEEGDSFMSQTTHERKTRESIAITRKCKYALRALRHRTDSCTLWVDAICT
jgi:hypothetical protein